jgi:nucleoside-diphosphate-sugar epimerase
MAALSGRVRRREAPQAAAEVAGQAAGRRHVVGMMTAGRGFSNAKAKRELGWELRYPSCQGFKGELARPGLAARAY